MPYPPHKKPFKKNSITPAKRKAPILQTFSECLKLTIQTYQMRNKELKVKPVQLQEKISKASLPVSADLSLTLTVTFYLFLKGS